MVLIIYVKVGDVPIIKQSYHIVTINYLRFVDKFKVREGKIMWIRVKIILKSQSHKS